MEQKCELNESAKYHGNDIFLNDCLFANLFNINYFLILNDKECDIKSKLLFEMYISLQQSSNNFAFYCFEKLFKPKEKNHINSNNTEKINKEFFLLCFENNCYIFDMSNPNFRKNVLFLLKIHKDLLLIGSRKKDVSRFMEYFEMENGIPRNINDENDDNKIIIIWENELLNEIEIEIDSIMNSSLVVGIKKQLQNQNQTKFDFIKFISFRIIMTYSIRRFYFPISSFSDSSFFGNEKDFYERTKNNYKNVSNMNDKYKPQENQEMQKMENKDFIILRAISKGSYAYISLAFHIHLEKLFVMKNFFDQNQYEKEKENYSRLKFYHPNVIKCYGYTKNSLIIEFMCNGTLQNFLEMKSKSKKDSFFIHWVSPVVLYSSTQYFHDFRFEFFDNQANKMKIIIEIFFGLSYLHLNDMIYCDFKPDNIFIDHNFLIHFGDFDLSCRNEFLASKSKKLKDIGTNEYFSPDILIDDDCDYTYNSDIFQVGLIIYAVCTGRNLFENINITENIDQMHKIIKTSPIKFTYGPFCSFYYKCLKLNRINRIPLFKIINELSEFHQFFQKLNQESACNYYYTDITQEIYFLKQIYYEILLGFIHLFYNEINKGDFNLKNLSQLFYAFIILFQTNELKNILKDISNEIRVITIFIENLFSNIQQFETNENYNYDQIKATKYSQLPILYLIYSNKNFIFFDNKKAAYYLQLGAQHENILSQYLLALKYFDGDEYFSKDISKSILYFTLAADAGNENAQYYLGEIYSSLYQSPQKIQIPQLEIDTNNKFFFGNQAIKYYKLGKKQNNSQSLFGLAVIYFNGECNLQASRKKAIHYLMMAKQQFHHLSITYFLKLYSSNLIYYDPLKFEKETTFLTESFNDVDAQLTLGSFYLQKNRNIELSKKFFKLASNQNIGIAYLSLGNIYLDEAKKCKSNDLIKKAFFNFQQAANLNEPTALYYVGCRYYLGDLQFVKKDQTKALTYLQKASSMNLSKAQLILGYIYFRGSRPNIQANISKSLYYFLCAAENKNHREKRAMNILGLFHLEGQIVKHDIQKAIYYFMNGKNLESDISTHQLGFLHEVGEKRLKNMIFIGRIQFYNPFNIYSLNFSYVKNLDTNFLNEFDVSYLKSYPLRAIQYYKESMSPPSMYNLAAIYFSGYYVKKDVYFAIELLQKCANYLNFASYFLFLLFLNGEENLIQIDVNKAKYYLERSNISPLNQNLTIEVLKNSRYFYQVDYNVDVFRKKDKPKNIDLNFYNGLLHPKFDDEIEYDIEYYEKLISDKKND